MFKFSCSFFEYINKFNVSLYQTDSDPVVRELNRQKLSITKTRKKTYFKAKEGLKMVQKGGFAFQIDLATAYKIIEVKNIYNVEIYIV